MDHDSPTPLLPPLLLRWIVLTRKEGQAISWMAYDGPWTIGHVMDQLRTLVSDIPRYCWRSTRLGSPRVVRDGREDTVRAAAVQVEAAYAAALQAPDHIAGGLDEALAYAEWKGIPPTPDLAWSKARHDGLNPFPIAPHRGQLQAWAEEDRRRGGRGMLTPAVMVEAFGPDWMERMCGA